MRDNDALAGRAAGGDHAAFAELVEANTPAMYRVALRITGNTAEAEDVAQDAWIAAWRSLDRFRQESAISTWLYRIVTNTALARLRGRAPTVPLDQQSAHTARLTDPEPSPEARAISTAEVDAALAEIARLELAQRLPLVLHELEGLSYQEVAEVLRISVDAVRSRLHRARTTLLRRLKERG